MSKPMAFHDAFQEWVVSLNLGSEGLNVIAIDGKSLRRSHDAKWGKGKPALKLVLPPHGPR
jgi:hypothetical protein